MRFFKLEQGSEEWFDWRKEGIGASESPIILGYSPFMTPLQLYNEKLGISEEFKSEWATKRGSLMEPTARQFYQNFTGIETLPVTVAHNELSWMRASLDGWSQKYKLLVEIKYPGSKDWELAEKGEIPKCYYYQIQHQMFVTQTQKAHYYAFNGSRGRLIVVLEDKDAQSDILSAAGIFMERLRHKDPPPLTERDTKIITPSDELKSKIALFRKLKSQIEIDKQALKAIESDIAQNCDHNKCSIDGLKVIKYTRRGSIDYKSIPILKNIELDKYRKDDIEIIQFRDKGDK